MKSVNVSIDEETWRAARVYAAKRDCSLSALVRAALTSVARREEPGQSIGAPDEDLVKLFDSIEFELGEMPSREERNAG